MSQQGHCGEGECGGVHLADGVTTADCSKSFSATQLAQGPHVLHYNMGLHLSHSFDGHLGFQSLPLGAMLSQTTYDMAFAYMCR